MPPRTLFLLLANYSSQTQIVDRALLIQILQRALSVLSTSEQAYRRQASWAFLSFWVWDRPFFGYTCVMHSEYSYRNNSSTGTLHRKPQGQKRQSPRQLRKRSKTAHKPIVVCRQARTTCRCDQSLCMKIGRTQGLGKFFARLRWRCQRLALSRERRAVKLRSAAKRRRRCAYRFLGIHTR